MTFHAQVMRASLEVFVALAILSLWP
jgi:hypothetical protein